ncbi:unnamed protein product [Caenorhabditis brenneri]
MSNQDKIGHSAHYVAISKKRSIDNSKNITSVAVSTQKHKFWPHYEDDPTGAVRFAVSRDWWGIKSSLAENYWWFINCQSSSIIIQSIQRSLNSAFPYNFETCPNSPSFLWYLQHQPFAENSLH